MFSSSRKTNISRLGVSTECRSQAAEWIVRKYLFARQWSSGQTMTEYALILAAVAVIVYAGYLTMGTNITGLLTSVDGNL